MRQLTSPTRIGGFEERWLDAQGVRLRYFAAGSGPPLVLIHGFGGSASNWRAVAPALAARFRVLVPELPGHGASTALPAPTGVPGFADRVALVLQAEQAERTLVVGHSFGGATALLLAERWPELVAGMLLVAPAGVSSAGRRARYLLALSLLLRPGRLMAPWRRRLARSPGGRRLAFGRWGAADPEALDPVAAEGMLAGPALHTDTVTAGRALYYWDVRHHLHAVACPALVLWGAEDRQLDLVDAFDLARRLRAPVRVVAGCGHLVPMERPDVFVDALRSLGDAVRHGPSVRAVAEPPTAP